MSRESKNDNGILVSGFAQTPKGIPAYEAYKYIGIILLIDKSTHTIKKADFSGIFSNLTCNVLRGFIEDFNVKNSFKELSDAIKQSVSIPVIGAVLQATLAAITRYEEHLKKYTTI